MDGVELAPVVGQELQSVGLDELERVARLWGIVHAHDLVEACTVIAHSRAASTAEQVQEPQR